MPETSQRSREEANRVFNMAERIILASSSEIRQQLLARVGLKFEVLPARIDEDAVKSALLAELAKPRDVADALAELKARKIGDKHPDALVIGSDQVLDFQGQMLSKPQNPDEAISQLKRMSGQRHSLLSAAVLFEDGKPVWRHVGVVRLHMRPLTANFIEKYVTRNWDSIRHSVGAYKLEEEGARLFTRIEGDHFNVFGLPLLELLSYLTLRGTLDA